MKTCFRWSAFLLITTIIYGTILDYKFPTADPVHLMWKLVAILVFLFSFTISATCILISAIIATESIRPPKAKNYLQDERMQGWKMGEPADLAPHARDWRSIKIE